MMSGEVGQSADKVLELLGMSAVKLSLIPSKLQVLEAINVTTVLRPNTKSPCCKVQGWYLDAQPTVWATFDHLVAPDIPPLAGCA